MTFQRHRLAHNFCLAQTSEKAKCQYFLNWFRIIYAKFHPSRFRNGQVNPKCRFSLRHQMHTLCLFALLGMLPH